MLAATSVTASRYDADIRRVMSATYRGEPPTATDNRHVVKTAAEE